jgi:hypothetical protein
MHTFATSIFLVGLQAPHVLPFLQWLQLVHVLQAGHGSCPMHFAANLVEDALAGESS